MFRDEGEYSRDMFGGIYQKNTDVLGGAPPTGAGRFGLLRVRSDAGDSKEASDSANTSLSYSPSRRTPTHKQSMDLSFDSPNPSLAAINQKTSAAASQANGANNNSNQPLWFNNPKRRTVPSRAIKRETFDEIEADSSFLTKSSSSANPTPGFKTLTFGTRRNNAESAHVNAFSDELPPMKTISDLQREDDNSDSFLSFNQTVGNISATQPPQQPPINGTPQLSQSKVSTPIRSLDATSSPQQQRAPSPLKATTGSESAVLVFGYPESIANEVIKHFGKFGKILEDFEVLRVDPLFHKSTASYPIFTGQGWVKLTYDNKASAIRAMEENGTVFHGCMLGCAPYSKALIENIASIQVQSAHDIGDTGVPLLQQGSSAEENGGMMQYASMHQKLTAKEDDKIFVKPKRENSSLYSSRDVQDQKHSDGILGKVNNWLFGWEDL